MPLLLTGGGKSLSEVMAPEVWRCHEWHNCPLHMANGVNGLGEMPIHKQKEAALFLALFDGGHLKCPEVEGSE